MNAAPLIAAVLLGLAQQQPEHVPTGPEIGSQVLDFSLKDATGRTQTLHSIMGAKGALLVFYRSSDW